MAPSMSLPSALHIIGSDAVKRGLAFVSRLHTTVAAGILLIPAVAAEYGYDNVNEVNQTYDSFSATPVNVSDDDGAKIMADVHNFRASGLDYASWVARATQIRQSGNPSYCVGNLSIALTGVGAAYQAGASGATTLLTLLPTAGALIGSPAKELWILYKLMPLAGVLSMLLSLGGNIVPMEVNDYERIDTFQYSGMVGSHPDEKADGSPEDNSDILDDAEKFAKEVHLRAQSPLGSKKSLAITFGIIMQLFWLGLIITACWFLQTGSIIVWWCTMKPWTFFWFAFVAASSLLENLAGVPFTRQWTIRVSRAPKVHISDDAPRVIPEVELKKLQRSETGLSGAAIDHGKAASSIDEMFISTNPLASPSVSSPPSISPQATKYTLLPQPWARGQILERLQKGYNTYGRIVMEPNQPWSAANNPFYVIVSVRGVSNAHAALRVFSKFLSIAVFTVGTATFASSTLITILIATITAVLIIVAGVFGRVTAMWMASQIMENKPVIHRVVKNASEAEEYIEAMLRKPNIVAEIEGHVITDGRCVKRYNKHLRWSKLLGVLAKPYDLTRLAVPYYAPA